MTENNASASVASRNMVTFGDSLQNDSWASVLQNYHSYPLSASSQTMPSYFLSPLMIKEESSSQESNVMQEQIDPAHSQQQKSQQMMPLQALSGPLFYSSLDPFLQIPQTPYESNEAETFSFLKSYGLLAPSPVALATTDGPIPITSSGYSALAAAPIARKSLPEPNSSCSTITSTTQHQPIVSSGITLHSINTDMKSLKPIIFNNLTTPMSMMMMTMPNSGPQQSIAVPNAVTRKIPNSDNTVAFNNMASLDRPTKLKKFRCNEPNCNYMTDRRGSLRRHQGVHSTECPYVCRVAGCEKRYKSASGFRRHSSLHDSSSKSHKK